MIGISAVESASRSRSATPWGSKQAVPFRSELLRARTVLIRRLCRLVKLGLGDCGGCYGEGRARRKGGL